MNQYTYPAVLRCCRSFSELYEGYFPDFSKTLVSGYGLEETLDTLEQTLKKEITERMKKYDYNKIRLRS